MEISYYVSWEQDGISNECNSSTVEDGDLLESSDSIDCLYSCSGVITKMSYNCTCYSVEDNWSFGHNQLTHVFNHTSDVDTVTIGSLGTSWSSEINGSWNISATFSLVTRNDTSQINSSPHVLIPPLIHLQEGCEHDIPLSVSDPDNDTVRCRWAVGRECKGICNKFPGGILDPDSCTIKYFANYGTGVKAVAIMIEDYIPGSTHPLSSVALQFLVSVSSSSQTCSSNGGYFRPYVIVHPSNAVIKSKSEFVNLTLICNASEVSSYYWKKKNGNISVNATGVNTSTLTLINAQTEDSGDYQCVVTSSCSLRDFSDYITISIIEGN